MANPSFARILQVSLPLAALLAYSAPAAAQFSYTLKEINPSSSSLDATDPNGASGGRVNGLGVAANGTTFFAASEWGGLWRSTDSGQNWSSLPRHLPMVTEDVEVDPSNAQRVYATSLYDGRVSSLSGIEVSGDGGNTWSKPASATPPAGFCRSATSRDEPAAYGIAINPANSQNVAIGTNCGVAISSDGGGTWTFYDPTPGDAGADAVYDVVIHHGGTIDLCGVDGHRRSTDGGAHWTGPTGTGLPAGTCKIAASPDESYVVFAVVGTTLYESDDGGAAWPNTFVNPGPQGRVPFVVTNKRSGSNYDVWFGDTKLWRASCTTPSPAASGGSRRCPQNSWTAVMNGAHWDLGDLLFAPGVASNACPVMMASDGGVFVNTSTSSPACQTAAWEQPVATPRALWMYSLYHSDHAGTSDEDLYFVNQDDGSYSSGNAQASAPTWSNRDCCDGSDVVADKSRVIYSSCCWSPGRFNRVFVRNVGMTGGGELGTYPPGNIPPWGLPDVMAQYSDKGYVFISTSGVYLSTDITASPIVWTQLGAATSPGSPRAIQVSANGNTPAFFVQAGAVDLRSADTLWRYDGTAGNSAWTQINAPGGTGGFGTFSADKRDRNHIFASHIRPGSDPEMVVTTDGGSHWTTLAALDTLMTAGGVFRYTTLSGPSVRGTNNALLNVVGYPQPTLTAIDPVDSQIMVAGGADSGLFVSINGGTDWTRVDDPLTPGTNGSQHVPRPTFAVFDHSVNTGLVNFLYRRLNIYIGSQGRGAWRLNLSIPRFVFPNGPISICQRFPDVCHPVIIQWPIIRIACGPGSRIPELEVDCVVRQPIPDLCKAASGCPGCTEGMCPPDYHLYLDGVDPVDWEVSIVDAKGQPARHDVQRTEAGVVVNFRPDKEHYVEGKIGDYELVLARRVGAAGGLKNEFRVRLETGDKVKGEIIRPALPVELRQQPNLPVRPH